MKPATCLVKCTDLQTLVSRIVAALALLMLLAALVPSTEAQCTYPTRFTSWPNKPQPPFLFIDTPPPAFPPHYGRLWESYDSSVAPWGDDGCPWSNWLLPTPGGNQAYIEGMIGEPGCTFWPRCPQGSLTVALERPFPFMYGDEANLLVLRTIEHPTQPHLFDFTVGFEPPISWVTLPFPPFPHITVQNVAFNGPTMEVTLEFDDLADNYFGSGFGPFPPPPPVSDTMESWDLVGHVGVEDPGRERSSWNLVTSVPYVDGSAVAGPLVFDCPVDPAQDQYLALGVTFSGGAGPSVRSRYVGASVLLDVDDDGDDHSVCDGDCDDGDESVYPGAPQICDGVNNDCGANWPLLDGTNEADDDGDSYSECEGDCNDSDPNNWISCATCLDDDGDGYYVGCDAYVTLLGPDNCPEDYNPSRKDSDGNGIGDACDEKRRIYVSCDALADYPTLQAAVDGAPESDTTIAVEPCTYDENVVVDRDMQLHFIGQPGTRQEVVVGMLAGTAIDIASSEGNAVMQLEGLTLRGETGLRTDVSTQLRDLHFESVSGAALRLDDGSHEAVGITMGSDVADGVHLAFGASLSLDRGRFEGLSGSALQIDGAASLANTQITQCSDGIVLGGTGELDLHYTTIADQTGEGLDNTANGAVTVASSVAYRNAGGDLVNLPCTEVAWSLVGTPDCSAVGDNLPSQDPLFDLDYSLTASSPCLDHGPTPSTYTGWPPTDGGGGYRLQDHDGNGMSHSDCGAYERENTTAQVSDVRNLRWILNWILFWDADPMATEYHIYRDDLASLSYGHFGICRDDLDPTRTDNNATEGSTPLPGEGYFYLVTAEDAGGDEGTLGFTTCAERSNYNPCP